MPGMNGTGPQWAGSQTGRGLGYCQNIVAHNPNKGRHIARMGRGYCGTGFGLRRNLNPTEITTEQHKNILEQQKCLLQKSLENIEEQISKLYDNFIK